MKKFILFPLLCIAQLCFSQVDYIGRPNSTVEVRNKLRIKANKNDANESYYLSTDVNGNVKLKLSSGSNCGLIQGGLVSWSGIGLTFDITSALYCINGTDYTFSGGNITLDAPDATFDRFDAIVLTTAGTVTKITGTPSANPQIPTANPATQLYLTAILVRPGGVDVQQQILWDENVPGEWTGSSGSTPFVNFDNTSNTYRLTKAADVAGTFVTQDFIQFNGTGYRRADYTDLKFFIRLKGQFTKLSSIQVQLLNGGQRVTLPLTLNASVGFNPGISGSYQNVTIPFNQFQYYVDVENITGIHFTLTQAGSAGFYLDYITLQGGVTNPGNDGRFVTLTFQRNDSVFYVKGGQEFFSHLRGGGGGGGTTYTGNAPIVVTGSVISGDTSKAAGKLATFTDIQGRWGRQGNAGTDPAIDFIGTTDNNNFVIKRNNQVSFTAHRNQNISIANSGVINPASTGTNNLLLFGNGGLPNLTTGENNVYSNAIGAFPPKVTSGRDNFYFGVFTGVNNTVGIFNIGIGGAALSHTNLATAQTGDYNIGIGQGAGQNTITSGFQNIYIGGPSTGFGMSGSASKNIIIGGRSVVLGGSGNRNITIGDSIELINNTASNQLNIGNLIYGTALDGFRTNISTGNIGIGVKAPSQKLEVAGGVRFSGALFPNNQAGTSGQYLRSNGSGSAPTWETPAGGTTDTALIRQIVSDSSFSTVLRPPLQFFPGSSAGVPDSASVDTVSTAGVVTKTQLATALSSLPPSGSSGGELEELVLIHRALGSQMIAQKPMFSLLEVNNTAITLVDNRIYLLPVVLKRDTVITGVKFANQAQGNYTADNNNVVGLYSYSGGTLTLVASSTNDGNLWKGAANSLQSKAFTTPYNATAGVYYVAMLYNNSAQTTAPALFGTNAFGNPSSRTLDHTNSAKLLGYSSGNTLPATQAMSGVTSASDWPWYMIY